MVRSWIVRAYNHPWWIPALSVVAVISLVGTMVLFVLYAADQSSERHKRISTDVAFCERANDLRRQVVAIGAANEEMLKGVIDVVLPPDATNGERAERILEIRAEMQPVFDEHSAAVDEIRLIDCASIPGAPSTTENP